MLTQSCTKYEGNVILSESAKPWNAHLDNMVSLSREGCLLITYDEAIRIAQEFAKEVADTFPGNILAVFAIGSLGSDYYRPGQSDIDTAIITNCGRQDVAKVEREVARLQDRYWKDYQVPKGFGAIVFAEEQLYPPYVAEEELILEILRLKTQSKLLYGAYST